jgi:hypothetical protein
VVELATDAEAITGTDAARAVTPANLAAVAATHVPAASESVAGKVELATDAETQTGTDTARAITPANLTARTATDARTGVVELATDAETQTGTDTARAITPANLTARTATDARTGVVELSTDAEAKAGTDTARAITPANLAAAEKNLKVLSFTGRNGAGACTLTGAAVGDEVVGIAGLTDMGGADASFEATVTVVDQIQQSAAGDLSLKNYLVILRPIV